MNFQLSPPVIRIFPISQQRFRLALKDAQMAENENSSLKASERSRGNGLWPEHDEIDLPVSCHWRGLGEPTWLNCHQQNNKKRQEDKEGGQDINLFLHCLSTIVSLSRSLAEWLISVLIFLKNTARALVYKHDFIMKVILWVKYVHLQISVLVK